MPKFTLPGRVRTGLFLLLILTLALTACGPGTPAAPSAEVNVTAVLAPAPEGPSGEYLSVTLTDKAGAPITDASVGLEGNMNHAGMVPVLADPVTANTDGVYQIPFAFTMRGDWIVTITATLADGTTFTQDVDLSVTADEVQVK